MSKLVYKTINEIINGKFIRENDINSGEDFSNALNSRRNDLRNQKNDIRSLELKKQRKVQNFHRSAANVAAQTSQELSKAQQQDENFDAQEVPGMPPVGMPPTAAPAPPPAPMPKPAAGPNYEGGNMTKTQLCQAHEATSNIMASIEDYDSLPDWVKAKITLASEYLVKCESFLNAKDQEHEDSQDEHMPKAPTPPAPSPMKPSTGGGTPMMGISLGRVQSVSPGE